MRSDDARSARGRRTLKAAERECAHWKALAFHMLGERCLSPCWVCEREDAAAGRPLALPDLIEAMRTAEDRAKRAPSASPKSTGGGEG